MAREYGKDYAAVIATRVTAEEKERV